MISHSYILIMGMLNSVANARGFRVHNTIRSFFVLSGLVLLSACATGPRPPALEFDPSFDFAAVKTIGYHDKSGVVLGDNPLQLSDMQRGQINQILSDSFQNQGYSVNDATKPADLLASWALVTQHQTDISSYQTSFGFGHGSRYGYWGSPYNCCYGGMEVVSRNYTQGRIILDMIDPTTGLSVWRGLAGVRIKNDPARDQEDYNMAVSGIVNAFPPR
ncbi:MAG: hypothetical protein ACI9NT_000928 [Bacteroidia bacterium]|jgi:hypothetical protein